MIHVELERLRTLKLNSSKAFNMSPVRIPDSKAFSHLLNLDLASTSIDASDLIALLPSFGIVEKLNLTSCTRVTSEALEQIVSRKRCTICLPIVGSFVLVVK